ncbi:MAG: DedA family protein [Minisyncoccota bacterium]
MNFLPHFDLLALIKTASYLGIFAIVFAESGLFFGFFLPGDSLLFTAGLLASQGFLNIALVLLVTAIAAISGDSVGYAFGYRVGPRIFTKEDSLFFHKKYVKKAETFFEKYGGKTLILARFMPGVRTFVPIMAGVGNMRYKTFLTYNIIGGVLWTLVVTLLGYFLGKVIPNVDHYLLPIIGLIVILSILPSVISILRARAIKPVSESHGG